MKVKLLDSVDGTNFILDNKQIFFYSCGITAQSEIHIGHCRTLIFYDSLKRFLIFSGYNVIHGTNITDVDHKINNKLYEMYNIKNTNDLCELKNNSLHEVYKNFVDEQCDDFTYYSNMLNLILPDKIIRVSQIISQIINYIQHLMENGFAYEQEGEVYFDIKQGNIFGDTRFNNLSKDMQNFKLWIKGNEKSVTFPSPWKSIYGGYPAWHITCSVINSMIFGDTVNIHGGGDDLLFPHHYCECLQSNAYHRKQVFQHFIHTAPITKDGIKMTKSIGNCVFISEALKLYSPNEIRIMCLYYHYSKSVDINELFEKISFAKDYLSNIKNIIDCKNEYIEITHEIRIEYDSTISVLCDNFKLDTFLELSNKFMEKYINLKQQQYIKMCVYDYIYILGLKY
jgi:cysteinyl-tRNA synthetase